MIYLGLKHEQVDDKRALEIWMKSLWKAFGVQFIIATVKLDCFGE